MFRRAALSSELDVTPYFLGCIGLFAAGGLLTLLGLPFPSAYDELQHLSFIAALRDAPTLFPAYGRYHVLATDLSDWTSAVNYIAHPPLFYIMLAPFGSDVMFLRALNLVMAAVGFALCASAGVSLLASKAQRITFLLLLLAFSKPVLIAGIINNDNLVLLETGLLFACIASSRDRFICIAMLLAAVGWTKLNAFIGLSMWAGLWRLFAIRDGRTALVSRETAILIAGMALGAIPAMANLIAFGTPAYVAVDFLYVAPSARPAYDFWDFAGAFFDKIGTKVLLQDGLTDLLPAIVITAIIAGFALQRDSASRKARAVAIGAWFAMLAFAGLHLAYGWNSFRALGSMSDAQSRYYVMLWPGFALATVIGGSLVVRSIVRVIGTRLVGEVS